MASSGLLNLVSDVADGAAAGAGDVLCEEAVEATNAAQTKHGVTMGKRMKLSPAPALTPSMALMFPALHRTPGRKNLPTNRFPAIG
jgi:hypothetical protein